MIFLAGRTSDAVRSGVGGALAQVEEDLAAIELGMMQIVDSVREHKKRKAEGDPLSVVKREKARKERNLRALELRRSGKTYREVGEIIGVGAQRAAQMCASAEWRERQWGISDRTNVEKPL